jgi:hypothetical protein
MDNHVSAGATALVRDIDHSFKILLHDRHDIMEVLVRQNRILDKLTLIGGLVPCFFKNFQNRILDQFTLVDGFVPFLWEGFWNLRLKFLMLVGGLVQSTLFFSILNSNFRFLFSLFENDHVFF